MRFFQNLTGVTVAVLVFASCNNVEFQKTSAGVPYKVFPNKKGDSIRQNYVVKFEVIQKTKDTVLFNTYTQKTPQFLQVQPLPGKLNYGDFGGNFMEILPKLQKGDSIYMVHSIDSLLKLNPQMPAASFKKGDQLITTFRITEVFKTEEEARTAIGKDRAAQVAAMDKESLETFKKDTASINQMNIDNRIIEDYLAKNNIQATKTDWGAYVQVINPGQGPKPTPGQFSIVKYTGKTLAGVQFDAGELPLQVGTGGVIKGFEEGVKQFAKGGKGVVYIPSRLGYGPNGSGDKISPNANLMFEIEILSISDNPPPQAEQQQHFEGDGHNH